MVHQTEQVLNKRGRYHCLNKSASMGAITSHILRKRL
jgi:hypothetical protein